MRILITGGVGTGKITLAHELSALLNAPVLPTDDALQLPEVVSSPSPWAAVNEEVAHWIARPGPWIIEGVRVPHALIILLNATPRPLPFTPPLICLTRALRLETHAENAMTASVMSAMLHCESRLEVPTLRTTYSSSLAAEIVQDLTQ